MHAARGVWALQSSSVDNVIGASLSKPHTNHNCMYVSTIRHPRVSHAYMLPIPHLKLHVWFLNNAHQVKCKVTKESKKASNDGIPIQSLRLASCNVM